MSKGIYSTSPSSASPSAEEHIGEENDGLRRYPQLKRLCDDFGLRVSQPDPEGQVARKSFGLVERHLKDERCLTPFFTSMSQLEAFVADNLVDILHDYFFGEHEGLTV